jgi:hypothetical protein
MVKRSFEWTLPRFSETSWQACAQGRECSQRDSMIAEYFSWDARYNDFWEIMSTVCLVTFIPILIVPVLGYYFPWRSDKMRNSIC